VVVTLLLLTVQIALGGWVSSNYAVLACSGFPQCNGQWWPAMDFREGFTLLRELGRAGDGGFLPFEALVAVHYVHRLFALFALAALLWLARALWRQPALRAQAKLLLGLTALQLASGLSNVVFDWPLAAALLHNAGAAALVLVLSLLLARSPGVPAARP
jgi:cytochrome c oxidase assembly protein subunit 15